MPVYGCCPFWDGNPFSCVTGANCIYRHQHRLGRVSYGYPYHPEYTGDESGASQRSGESFVCLVCGVRLKDAKACQAHYESIEHFEQYDVACYAMNVGWVPHRQQRRPPRSPPYPYPYCQVCETVLGSREHLNVHLGQIWHQRSIESRRETGAPAPPPCMFKVMKGSLLRGRHPPPAHSLSCNSPAGAQNSSRTPQSWKAKSADAEAAQQTPSSRCIWPPTPPQQDAVRFDSEVTLPRQTRSQGSFRGPSPAYRAPSSIVETPAAASDKHRSQTARRPRMIAAPIKLKGAAPITLEAAQEWERSDSGALSWAESGKSEILPHRNFIPKKKIVPRLPVAASSCGAPPSQDLDDSPLSDVSSQDMIPAEVLRERSQKRLPQLTVQPLHFSSNPELDASLSPAANVALRSASASSEVQTSKEGAELSRGHSTEHQYPSRAVDGELQQGTRKPQSSLSSSNQDSGEMAASRHSNRRESKLSQQLATTKEGMRWLRFERCPKELQAVGAGDLTADQDDPWQDSLGRDTAVEWQLGTEEPKFARPEVLKVVSPSRSRSPLRSEQGPGSKQEGSCIVSMAFVKDILEMDWQEATATLDLLSEDASTSPGNALPTDNISRTRQHATVDQGHSLQDGSEDVLRLLATMMRRKMSPELIMDLAALAIEGLVMDDEAVTHLSRQPPRVAKTAVERLTAEVRRSRRIRNASSYIMGILRKMRHEGLLSEGKAELLEPSSMAGRSSGHDD